MSADANSKTIMSVYEAFGRGDVAAILDAVTDDVDWAAEAAGTASQLTKAPRFLEQPCIHRVTKMRVIELLA